MKVSSNLDTSAHICLYLLFQNQRPHFLLSLLSRRISQPFGQDQQNVKYRSPMYHPS